MKRSRRDLLKLGAMAGAGMVLPAFSSARLPILESIPKAVFLPRTRTASAGTVGKRQPPDGLARFVNQLPDPPVIGPMQQCNLTFRNTTLQKVRRDLPATPIWGYKTGI